MKPELGEERDAKKVVTEGFKSSRDETKEGEVGKSISHGMRIYGDDWTLKTRNGNKLRQRLSDDAGSYDHSLTDSPTNQYHQVSPCLVILFHSPMGHVRPLLLVFFSTVGLTTLFGYDHPANAGQDRTGVELS